MLQKSCIFIIQYFDTALMQGVNSLHCKYLLSFYSLFTLDDCCHDIIIKLHLYLYSCAKCPLIVVCTTRFFPFSTLTIVSLRLWSHLGTLYGQFWSWSFYASWFLGVFLFFLWILSLFPLRSYDRVNKRHETKPWGLVQGLRLRLRPEAEAKAWGWG